MALLFFGRKRRLLKIRLVFYSLVLIYIGIVLWPLVVVTVPAGSVGVMWYRFFGGTVTGSHLGEGMHVKLPWDEAYIYSIRLKRLTSSVVGLTSDGVAVTLNLSVTYSVNPDQVGAFNKLVGDDFEISVLAPALTSVVLLVLSQYPTDEVYGMSFAEVHQKVIDQLKDRMNALSPDDTSRGRLVDIFGVDLTSIVLPSSIGAAIDQKIQAEQDVLRHKSLVAQEQLESDRRQIEGKSLDLFQTVVSQSLTDNYLRWKAIEATSELARAPNSKTIVIGAGAGNMPLILGDFGAGPPAAAPPIAPLPAPNAVTAPAAATSPVPISITLPTVVAPLAAPQAAPVPAAIAPAPAAIASTTPVAASPAASLAAQAAPAMRRPEDNPLVLREGAMRRPLQDFERIPSRPHADPLRQTSDQPQRSDGLSRQFGRP